MLEDWYLTVLKVLQILKRRERFVKSQNFSALIAMNNCSFDSCIIYEEATVDQSNIERNRT